MFLHFTCFHSCLQGHQWRCYKLQAFCGQPRLLAGSICTGMPYLLYQQILSLRAIFMFSLYILISWTNLNLSWWWNEVIVERQRSILVTMLGLQESGWSNAEICVFIEKHWIGFACHSRQVNRRCVWCFCIPVSTGTVPCSIILHLVNWSLSWQNFPTKGILWRSLRKHVTLLFKSSALELGSTQLSGDWWRRGNP